MYERDTIVKKANEEGWAMPHPAIIFNNLYKFIDVKALHRTGKRHQATIVSEGFVDGKLVTKFKKEPSKQPAKIKLEVDNKQYPFVANGSDVVKVTASITDWYGNVKRNVNYRIKFEIFGEAQLVDDGKILSNPKEVKWGTCPILIRSTNRAGKIKIRASIYEGPRVKIQQESFLEFESIPTTDKFVQDEFRLQDFRK
jgi:beta-galactosidase